MKNIIKQTLLLTVAISLIACNWNNHGLQSRSITEEYYQETPSLSQREAKQAIKQYFKESDFDGRYYSLLKTGYYECNSLEERENLYKLKVNAIIDLSCNEIMKDLDTRTYWVDVRLTEKGKRLLYCDGTHIYAEDMLTEEQLDSAVNSKTMINEYGELLLEDSVSASVRQVIIDFYAKYQTDKSEACESYGTSDLIAATERIEKYMSYSGNGTQTARPRFWYADGSSETCALVSDPFIREGNIDTDSCLIYKYSEYEETYILLSNGDAYLFVIKDADGIKMIDDVLLSDPLKYSVNPSNTLRSVACNISDYQMKAAKEQKEARERWARYYGNSQKTETDNRKPEIKNQKSEDDFIQQNAPGLVAVERNTKTEYQKAVERENIITVRLYAYRTKIEYVDHIVVETEGEMLRAVCRLVMKVSDLNAVGRIIEHKSIGETKEEHIYFARYTDGWFVE